jgi:hypothetical protein
MANIVLNVTVWELLALNNPSRDRGSDLILETSYQEVVCDFPRFPSTSLEIQYSLIILSFDVIQCRYMKQTD